MKHYVITGRDYGDQGIVFSVEDDASEDEICEAAWEAVTEHVSFDWTECDEDGHPLENEDQ